MAKSAVENDFPIISLLTPREEAAIDALKAQLGTANVVLHLGKEGNFPMKNVTAFFLTSGKIKLFGNYGESDRLSEVLVDIAEIEVLPVVKEAAEASVPAEVAEEIHDDLAAAVPVELLVAQAQASSVAEVRV